MPHPCPFCALPPERIIEQTPLARVIRDGFPVSPGHTLILPRRHVGSFFETTAEERTDLLLLLDRAQTQLAAQLLLSGKIEALPDRGGVHRDACLVAFPPRLHAAPYADAIASYTG